MITNKMIRNRAYFADFKFDFMSLKCDCVNLRKSISRGKSEHQANLYRTHLSNSKNTNIFILGIYLHEMPRLLNLRMLRSLVLSSWRFLVLSSTVSNLSSTAFTILAVYEDSTIKLACLRSEASLLKTNSTTILFPQNDTIKRRQSVIPEEFQNII